MLKNLICFLLCFWLSVQVSYAQKEEPTLWKSPEGKYYTILYSSSLSAVAEADAQDKTIFYLITDELPNALQVEVKNTCLNKTLVMTTKVDNSFDKYDLILSDNPSSKRKLIEDFDLGLKRDCYDYLKDSLESVVKKAATRPKQEEFYAMLDSIYKRKTKTLFEIKYYVPIDSLLKNIDEQTNQEKLRSFKYLFDFMRKSNLKEAIEYGEQAIELAKLTQNEEIEAELWIALSTFKNERAGRFFKLGYEYSSVSRSKVLKFGATQLDYDSYDEIIQAIAKKTNFSVDDIKRWNHLWGYANEFNLYYYSQKEVKLYDDVEQLSDKELLEYLRIRTAQKDTNKIVWAYNALGNLYQIKYGYEEAEKYYLEMLKIRTQQQDKEKIYWIWGHLGYFYLKQEKFDLSMDYFTKLLDARKQEKNVEQIIWALGGLRFTKLSQGLPEEALAYQKQIFELYADLKQNPSKYYGIDPKDYRYLVLSVVISDYLRSFPDKSKSISDYLIKWQRGKLDTKENKVIANKIIEIATETGDFEEAIEVIKEILKIEKDNLAKIGYFNDVAFMYQKQGKYKESLDYYQKASKEAKKSKDMRLIAIQHQKIGFFYKVQNKDKEAQEEYSKLLEILKKMKRPSFNNDEYTNEDEYAKEYEYNRFIESLENVCQYLLAFPEKKELLKLLAQEAIRLSDNEWGHYRFSRFLRK